MTGIRRAFLLTSLERYLVLGLNFGVIILVSRLLTPAEIGLAVLGTSLLAVAETLRDFGTGSYLIQHRDAGRERVRTAFTVMAIVSASIVVALLLLAGPVAALYGDERLAPYLRVIALGFLAGPISAPVVALLRRDLRFGRVVIVNVGSSLAGAAATVGLVLLGQGYMSFAWGGLAWCVMAALLAIAVRRDLSIFRFRLEDWRGALAFGGYNSATAILNRLWDVLPYLALGRLQSPASVGLLNRSLLLAQLPDRVLLAGVVGVALPALSAEAREGRALAAPYLRALAYITAVQWPTLAVVALLAHPAVLVMFGPQWLDIVPLVQLLCAAQAFAAPAPLSYPVLVAAGAVRDTLTSSLVSLPVSAALLLLAAQQGVTAVAASMLVIIPLQVAVVLVFIRRRLRFRWTELACAVAPGAAVAACAAGVPAAAILLQGGADLAPASAAAAVLGGIGGWMLGLRLTRHPLGAELLHLVAQLRRMLRSGAPAKVPTLTETKA